MSIQFRCTHCRSSFPVDSQLRDNPNECPLCKTATLKAEVTVAAARKPAPVSRKPAPASAKRTLVAAATTVEKPTNPVAPVAESVAVRRRIDWRIVGAAGAGAAFVVGCLVFAVAHRTPRAPEASVTPEEPVAVAQVEAPEAAPKPEPKAEAKAEPVVAETPKEAAPIEPIPPVPEAKPEEPVAKPTPPPAPPVAEKKPLVLKRRTKATDEDLRRDLLLIPEMNVRDIPLASRTALSDAPKNRKISAEEMPDFRGLPMRMGIDCQIGDEEAKTLQALSRKLRTAMVGATPNDGVDSRPNPDSLRSALSGKEWQQPEAVATLNQMLMPEGRRLRLVLVELLAKIPSPKATTALAQRALFDLSADVREAAVNALRDRPIADYRADLVNAFRYPWAPAADHAAEALIALEDRQSLPELVSLLREPDPGAAFRNPEGEPVVREMVRINHLANCTMCHAASPNAHELVRGRVPSPSEPLPPPVEYYSKGGGIFVRADVTYLKQDFSVPQPVTKPGPWPTHQRYDYMVRLRPLKSFTLAEQVARIGKAKEEKFPQREAVLFALREITGKDAGRSPESWELVLRDSSSQRR